jgi:ribosomal protein S18 acetylase RimI-like enzyme
MPIIRKMSEQDIDRVRPVEAAGFGAWWRQLKGETAVLPMRTRSNLLTCLEKDPEGSFVAEDDGRVVGFIFSRTWGKVGWFGAFAVQPEYQGKGIGKALITASLEYLSSAQLSVIGLETMPELAYNLGLYLRQGFQARYPTLLLTRRLVGVSEGRAVLQHWSSTGKDKRQLWIADLLDVAASLPPGFDYSKEILVTQQYAQGETLLLMDGNQVIGMSIVLLASQREDWDAELASVYVLAIHPAYTNAASFEALIRGSESFAYANGKQNLAVWVNARYAWALKQLLGMGYRVERAMQRMVLEGLSEGSQDEGLVNLNRWAG